MVFQRFSAGLVARTFLGFMGFFVEEDDPLFIGGKRRFFIN